MRHATTPAFIDPNQYRVSDSLELLGREAVVGDNNTIFAYAWFAF
jgi:hypothetical protein